jgi:hypothetical protein
MLGILTPISNMFIAMGASPIGANILIIIFATGSGAILGFWMDPNSTHLAKFCAGLGLFFGIVLMLAEYKLL